MLKLHNLLYALGAVTVTILLLFLSSKSLEAQTSPWMGTSTLKLEKQFDFTGARPLNEARDCYPENISSCVIAARYGFVDSNGAVKLNGSDSYYNVTSYVSNQGIVGIPRSDAFITYSSEPSDGVFIYFNKNFVESTTLIDKFGKRYKITKAPEWKLADKNNNRIAVDIVSRAYSQNGQWMVVAAPYIGIIRINLDTYEILPFGPAYNYGVGLSPLPQLSITNDGRYAIASSGDFNNFNLYDLNTCVGPVPARITKALECQSRNIHSYLQSQLSGYLGSSNIRFISNDTFSFNSRRREGSTNTAARYTLTNNLGPAYYQDYLALGDSYISGEGAYNYQPGTDTDNNGCHLSLDSYPLLLGKYLNFNSYRSIACSGATTGDLIDSSGDYQGQQKNKVPQKRLLPEELNDIKTSFLPGRINQSQFILQYRPKVIMVSVGGNDIGFTNIIKRCLAPDTCYSTYEDRVELIRQINRKFSVLASTYSLVKSQAPYDTKVFVIGYPQIANPNGSCGLNVHLDAGELVFAQQLISYLDGVIKSATDKTGVAYIDTQSALDGYKLCEGKPGEIAVNGLSAGNDFPAILGGPIGKESFHPNELGQKLLRDYILQYSENLNKSMPFINNSATYPTENSQSILAAPKSGRQINISSYDDRITDDTVIRALPFLVNLEGSEFSIKPNSSVNIVLNSSPTALGTYQTDTYGNVTTQLTIPASVGPGIHTLHIYGTDISGQSIDVYKTIFVGQSNNRLGPGNCAVVQTSGVDYDQDGLDDSCDGNITEPKAKTPYRSVSVTGGTATNQTSIASSFENSTPAESLNSPDLKVILKPTTKTLDFGYVLDDLNNISANPNNQKNEFVLASSKTPTNLQSSNEPMNKLLNATFVIFSGFAIVGGWTVWRTRS